MVKCVERKNESLDKSYSSPCKGTHNISNITLNPHL